MTVIPAPLVITTTSLPGGAIGETYGATLTGTGATLTAAGGVGPYTWSLASGSSLPAGLSLDSSTGVISGTPQGTGSYTFTLQAADSENPPATDSQTYMVVVAGKLTLTTTSLPEGTAGDAYSTTLTATGGVGPYLWVIAAGSTLPSGVTLNSSTGVLSGIPESLGSFTLNILVWDSTDVYSAPQSFTLVITG
jgi:hypothetical protein